MVRGVATAGRAVRWRPNARQEPGSNAGRRLWTRDGSDPHLTEQWGCGKFATLARDLKFLVGIPKQSRLSGRQKLVT
jgi:hypothetical protein